MMLIVLLTASAPFGAEAAALDLGNSFERSGRTGAQRHAKDVLAIPSITPESKEPVHTPVRVSSVRDSKDYILILSSDNFATTVMKTDSSVEHWIVKFCVDSWQCRKLTGIYKGLGATWQKLLNFSPAANLPVRFANMVRFAEVDCTVDKQLCVDQGVESVPSVVHFHRRDLARGSSKISATHMWSGEVQSLAQWLDNKFTEPLAQWLPKVAQVAEPITGKDSVKLSAAEASPTKPPNAWEQATTELSVMLQDFDGYLDKQDVTRDAAYTALLAVSLAIVGSLWRFGWLQQSPPLAPEEQSPLPVREVRKAQSQQELQHMRQPEASIEL